jgi:hypothetical protein
MAFDVYPSPPNSPLNVGANSTSGLIPIAQRIGPDNVSEPGANATGFPDTMFIRLAMLGPVPAPAQQPTIILKANTGAEVEITDVAPNVTPIFDGALVEVADGRKHTPDADNVYLIKVFVNDTGGITWQMRIKNNDGAARDFTWVIADSLDGVDGLGNHVGSRQPWIDSPTTLNFDVLTPQSPAPRLTVPVANKGTGPLNITNAVGSDAGSPDFKVGEVPGPIAPNNSGDLKIDFIPPATAGQVNANFDISTNDTTAQTAAGHNRRIALQGVARRLEIALLLDDSGSMSWEPDGDPIPPGVPPSRFSSLASAATEFLDLLGAFGENRGTFGVARFPATNPADPLSFDVVTPTTIPGNMTTAKNAINAMVPFFAGTPMGDAINRALTPAANYFTTDPTGVDLNRRWIILMTDGAENSSVHNSLEFIAPAFGGTAAPGASLADKKIRVFAVGYGVVGKAEVNYALLEQIAAGSLGGGDKRQVESSGLSATQLAAAFRDAIKSGVVPVSSPTDPSGRLTTSRPEARHQVIITPYDTKAVFVLHWNTEDAKRMKLQLLTPTCDLITPESAGEGFVGGEIGFSGASRYQMYRISNDYLRNTSNPSSPRDGVWTLVVSSDQLGGIIIEGGDVIASHVEDSETYDYDVIVESRLQLNVSLDRATYFAGDPIGVTAIVTLDGKPITQATVSLSVTAPNEGVNNFLAAVNITAAEFREAQEEIFRLTNRDTNALFIKAHAARKKGISFSSSAGKASIPMTDPDHRGEFSAKFNQTSTPDTYVLYVTAVGTTEDGVTFRREKRLQTSVEVRPEPQFTLFDIVYRQIIDEGRTINIADVRVIPRDRFGNVVLVDSEIDPRVRLNVKSGEFTGPLVSNLDGSYIRSVRFRPGATPSISLDVRGEKIVAPQKLTPVDQLHYVDRVTAFKLGGEAEKGANKHTDPNVALGDVRLNKPDEFVSLGAFGSLAVEIKRHVIEAQGDDDITVFVRPDDSLRSYLVEALPFGKPPHKQSHGRKKNWVALGASPGVTQSFSLSSAGIKRASAIRITDKSGRTRDINFKPSSSPGVSIFGVGVKKIRRGGDHKGPHDDKKHDDKKRDDKKHDDKKKGGDRDYSHRKPGGERKLGHPKGVKPGAKAGVKPGAKPEVKPGAKPDAKQKPPKSAKGRSKK